MSGWYGAGLQVVNADGTGITEIAAAPYPDWIGSPSWSPDGQRLLFSRNGGVPTGVYLINADGSNETKLVDSAGNAVWSPDGQRIAYMAWDGQHQTALVVADDDGSNPHVLASEPPYVGGIAWSPDGQWIAFSRGDWASSQLMLIRPDGSDLHVADTGGFSAYDPAWRPAGPLPADRRPCIVRGNSKANVIRGTDRGDLILGGGGNDTIYGRGGDDVLIGGPGHDRLYGSAGDDVLDARDRIRDFLFGGSGKDNGYVDCVDRLTSIEYRHHAKP